MGENMFHFTSISHRRGWNYQTDFSGKNEHDAIEEFNQYCVGHNAEWGHLFYQETGAGVRSYFKGRGLVDFEG